MLTYFISGTVRMGSMGAMKPINFLYGVLEPIKEQFRLAYKVIPEMTAAKKCNMLSSPIGITRKYPLYRYILGVIKHTTT